MAGIFSGDFRLQRENERLKRELAHAKADNIELLHHNAAQKEDVARWRAYGLQLGVHGQMINENLERLREQVLSLGASQERNFQHMSEQLTNLNTALDEVDSAVTGLAESVASETQQVLAELERLNNQNPNIDLGPAITRLSGLRDNVNQQAQQVASIIADAAPTPTPEPNPTPAPEGRRR